MTEDRRDYETGSLPDDNNNPGTVGTAFFGNDTPNTNNNLDNNHDNYDQIDLHRLTSIPEAEERESMIESERIS